MDDRHAGNVVLLRVACLSLLIALVLAWCLSLSLGLRLPFLLELFKDTDRLLSSHLDFLMMTMLLLGFYNLKIPFPFVVRWGMAIGSITNPTVFLIQALAPTLASPVFLLFIYTSITITTIGYAMAAIIAFRTSLR